jgi:ADP-heptose:LPS heptosyltransferase
MKINLMRKIDYWGGVPLCFLLSLSACVQKVFSFKKPKKNTIEKVLFIKLSELGAIILAYPLLKRIKDKNPLTQLFFITFAKNKDIFALLGGIIPEQNILVIREDSIWVFVLDTLRIIRRSRKERLDLVFDLEFFSRFTSILAYLSRAEKRVGFYKYAFEGLYRGALLTHRIQYNPLNHVSKTYLSLSQVITQESKVSPELEEAVEDREIVFPVYISKKEVSQKIKNQLKSFGVTPTERLFLLNPGEGVIPLREWPLENFISLSRKILEDTGNHVILIGTEGVAQKEKILLKDINNARCQSLIGQTTLEELIELFGNAHALVSNDCGLAHLAMISSSIKKFIIFGPESPQIFAPLGDNNWIIYSNWPCSPCLSVLNHRISTCSDNRCLKAIQPDSVYELIKNSCK